MTNANQQIITAYETLGLTPEQIAESQGFDVLAVKAILNQCSCKYRQDVTQDTDLDFKDADLETANDIIRQTAQFSDDEYLRFRAAIYMRNDKKGRLDVKRDLRAMNFNITVLNTHLQAAQQALEATRTLARPAPQIANKAAETVDV